MTRDLYIGLLSGTSADAIDVALVDLSAGCQLIHNHSKKLSEQLRNDILSLYQPGENEIDRFAQLDQQLGEQFSEAVLELLEKYKINAQHVTAIGSHGQTIRHRPDIAHPFTLQIGDPNRIAAGTGITTVADFRRRDMALGGQGAPLVPAFHAEIFGSPDENRCVVNIGGIANLTYLPKEKDDSIIGFDTGPGNCLLDAWIAKQQQKPFDQNGEWARSGSVHTPLLQQCLRDPYFQRTYPKSTGREYFHLDWLQQRETCAADVSPADVQATLLELTAQSIANDINRLTDVATIIVCGGGAHNEALISRLQTCCTQTVMISDELGVDCDWIEACAFAWLAKRRLDHQPGSIKSVTGASHNAILGAVYAR